MCYGFFVMGFYGLSGPSLLKTKMLRRLPVLQCGHLGRMAVFAAYGWFTLSTVWFKTTFSKRLTPQLVKSMMNKYICHQSRRDPLGIQHRLLEGRSYSCKSYKPFGARCHGMVRLKNPCLNR
jgi:hypothetical protein